MDPRPKLDDKTQLLVVLGAAVAARCQRCFAKLYARIAEAGVTDEEVRAVVALATKVNGHAHEFMLAFVDETMKGAAGRNSPGRSADDASCEKRRCC
jgi:hypothetical protein